MSQDALLAELKNLKTHFSIETEGGDGASQIIVRGVISEDTCSLLQNSGNHGVLFDSIEIIEDDLCVELGSLPRYLNKEFKAEVSPTSLRNNGSLVFANWRGFLSYKPNLTNVPSSFWIVDTDSLYPSSSEDEKTQAYLHLVQLLEILQENTDHTNYLTGEIVSELIYLHKSRLNIPYTLDESVLTKPFDGISVVESLFNNEEHKEQKKSILKEVLYSFLHTVPADDRLKYLVSNFGDFSTRLNENYQLFVSEFSFDDVRKEYEENKRDYLVKLNEIYSSVIVKMLGIPVALALIAIKISAVVDSTTFWTNLFLLFSVIIYASMMIMLVFNQKHTLEAICSEYTSHMARLKHQYPKEFEKIVAIKTELDTRKEYQDSCLNVFRLMSFSLLGIVVAYFLWNLPWKSILGI
ncbi:hypothetical protein F0224_22370 [Vibrio coralliilyticus]|uniref:hypothetical protein n=1 Tax=Vibrio coralliilyticus TaxID=190893 RepID=UPI000BAC1526|nr:hypothetical protein [Vibrio coralliilyticus]NOI78414.1 hypothetical protein [Vibrio coralliilyticus]PAW01280.1 hypothetical protein CKJ79_22785 [Vibrio coralliilyticus]